MSEQQTWTDEQLAKQLEQWSALTVDEQNKLNITFTLMAGQPFWKPCAILSFEDVAIALTYAQALTVEAWLQAHNKTRKSEIMVAQVGELLRKVYPKSEPMPIPSYSTMSAREIIESIVSALMPHHDGKLEGRNPYFVQHILGLRMPSCASVKIGHGDISGDVTDDEVWLSPEQALSLLAWLEQEKATLERLAKERAK